MNEEINQPQEVVLSKIYEIRGIKVMLDRDHAALYDVKAIRLREQVKRNPKKFPEHFMFQLTEKETNDMVSHFAIPSKQHLGGTLPYVFTEHGILQSANYSFIDGYLKRFCTLIYFSVFLLDRYNFLIPTITPAAITYSIPPFIGMGSQGRKGGGQGFPGPPGPPPFPGLPPP